MSFVIDASVVLSLLLPDENSDRSDRFLVQLMARGAQAPNLLMLEVSNAIAMAVKRKCICAHETEKLASLFDQLRIEFDLTSALRLPEIRRISEHYAMTTYDASYLELAQRHRLPLATYDGKMQDVARQLSISLADG